MIAFGAKMKYEGLFTVAGPGHGGGLALFWKQNGSVSIKSSSPNYIDTEIHLTDTQCWRLTCFYGYPERARRKESWHLLRTLASQSTLPWAILGDFNDMLRASEKKGTNPHPKWLFNGFRDTMFDCGISDLPLEGFPFTWERGRGTVRWVQEKLDRVFVNEEWQRLFPTNKVQNLIAPTSDHSAIFLQVSVWRQVPNGYRFRFENSWLKEERCSEIVADCWAKNEGRDIADKIESCATSLKVWGERVAKNFKEKLNGCRGRMERFRSGTDSFSVQCYKEATKEYSILLSQQEDFWKQRAKQHWLQAGDSNSKFFHAYASARRKKNQISQLKDEGGQWRNWSNGLGELIKEFYGNLFQAQDVEIGELLECISERITYE